MVLMDETLFVMQTSGIENPEAYIHVSGLNLTAAVLGETVKSEDEYQVRTASKMVTAIKQSALVITAIDMTKTASITLKGENDITVRVGSVDEIEGKLQKAYDIMEVLKADGKQGGTLDVTTSKGGSYLP